MEFQNTIAYGTFYSDGGIVDLDAGTFVSLGFLPVPVPKLVKNIEVRPNPVSFNCLITQNGAYYIDFSFIATNGDNKTYTLAPFINNVQVGSGTKYELQFYQQNTTQRYEVSGSYIFDLNRDDVLEFKISVGSLPALDFIAHNLKITIVNLQQLGIH